EPAQRTVAAIRAALSARAQTLPLGFFDGRPHGELMSRLTNDVETINLVLTESVTQLAAGALAMVGIAGVMFWINPWLALVSVLIVPTMSLALTRWVAARTRT